MEKLFENNDFKKQISNKDLIETNQNKTKNVNLKTILKAKFIEWSTSSTR
jgi:hypothetical protein